MTTRVRHDPDRSVYELLVDDAVVSVLGYDRRGDTVVLLHTATEVEHRNRGHASALVAAVLPELEAAGDRVIVRCPFVRWHQEAQGAPG